MIRTDAELKSAKLGLAEQKARIEMAQKKLAAEGLGPEQVARALAPIDTFSAELESDIAQYERLRAGQFDALENFEGLPCQLIGLRIYHGLTQRDLAKRLSVSESSVSRDERNEYHGITVERLVKVLGALNAHLYSQVTTTPAEEPVYSIPEPEAMRHFEVTFDRSPFSPLPAEEPAGLNHNLALAA